MTDTRSKEIQEEHVQRIVRDTVSRARKEQWTHLAFLSPNSVSPNGTSSAGSSNDNQAKWRETLLGQGWPDHCIVDMNVVPDINIITMDLCDLPHLVALHLRGN